MIRPLLLAASLFLALSAAHAQDNAALFPPLPATHAQAKAVPDPIQEASATQAAATEFGPHDSCPKALQLKADSYREGLSMEDRWLASNYPHHFVFDRHDVVCGTHRSSATVLYSQTERAVIVYFDQSQYGKSVPAK